MSMSNAQSTNRKAKIRTNKSCKKIKWLICITTTLSPPSPPQLGPGQPWNTLNTSGKCFPDTLEDPTGRLCTRLIHKTYFHMFCDILDKSAGLIIIY